MEIKELQPKNRVLLRGLIDRLLPIIPDENSKLLTEIKLRNDLSTNGKLNLLFYNEANEVVGFVSLNYVASSELARINLSKLPVNYTRKIEIILVSASDYMTASHVEMGQCLAKYVKSHGIEYVVAETPVNALYTSECIKWMDFDTTGILYNSTATSTYVMFKDCTN